MIENIQNLRNFYVETSSEEEFLKVKLILELHFKSAIKQNLLKYKSRFIYVYLPEELRCSVHNPLDIVSSNLRKISVQDILES